MLQRHVVAFAAAGDMSPTVVEAFRSISQSIAERIDSIKAQLAALPEGVTDVAQARALYERLQRFELVDAVAGLRAGGDVVGLRDVLMAFVQSATITARQGDGRGCTWARAAVTWTPDAQQLLDAGLLVLGPEPETPVALDRKERARARLRRWRARQKAAQEPKD